MNTPQPFKAVAEERLAAIFAETDDHAAKCAGFHRAAESARALADDAAATFRKTLSDRDCKRLTDAHQQADAAELIGRIAGDPAEVANARRDAMPVWQLLSAAFDERGRALEKALPAARRALAQHTSEAIEHDRCDPETERTLHRHRHHVTELERQIRAANVAARATAQRANWIANGRSTTSEQPFDLERTMDSFLQELRSPLPSVETPQLHGTG